MLDQAHFTILSSLSLEASTEMAASSQADSGHSLRGFDIAMIIIPTVAVTLRFWSRVLSGHASKGRVFWWDDWTALMALVRTQLLNDSGD